MSPKRLPTRRSSRAEATNRSRIAQKYLEVADLAASEDGEAINVAVGLAVLAGIAAGDAITSSAIGERYSGKDHSAAADVLGRVDSVLGAHLRDLVSLKPHSHYGDSLLSSRDRARALRSARILVEAAQRRMA